MLNSEVIQQIKTSPRSRALLVTVLRESVQSALCVLLTVEKELRKAVLACTLVQSVHSKRLTDKLYLLLLPSHHYPDFLGNVQ